MKLSFVIGGMGFTAENLSAKATVTFENDMISAVQLDVEGKVPGMTAEQFADATQDAKENCPISRSLNAEITMEAKLVD
jgi:osmotically inducible protein OsmC